MAQGSFVGLPVATLTSLRDKYVSCLEAIAVHDDVSHPHNFLPGDFEMFFSKGRR